ncbi:hypothetical protein SAMN05428946_0475 [Edaphobacillus lindanitolerans]|uniref:Uncharacterized protein n=1 Tax=Edaphobacillus lindanitolerans TaxID=550447 RepID=A0A1U7PLP3_9BACI|nr:hypothetical protein SAMN05428946_0475 [Edaphobacillus lindanitolerans]
MKEGNHANELHSLRRRHCQSNEKTARKSGRFPYFHSTPNSVKRT